MTEIELAFSDAFALCRSALTAAGASDDAAACLARASVDAELAGKANVGVAHLIDHLQALRAGRINGNAKPTISRPAQALFHVDADGGTAQLGFELVIDDFELAARGMGIALFAQRNAYTCGALGWFGRRLADRGLVAFAATSGPALLAGSGSTKPVFCTNPVAFAAPRAGGPPLVIDQASSATAFVNIRQAARDGQRIPEGWAVDADGNPTNDPAKALKGALLAFGGARGANIALMVEVLAAGLTGANWALDAPSFTAGSQSPGSGLLIIAITPELIDPDFQTRLADQLDRLERDYGVHIPGKRSTSRDRDDLSVSLPVDLVDTLRRWSTGEVA